MIVIGTMTLALAAVLIVAHAKYGHPTNKALALIVLAFYFIGDYITTVIGLHMGAWEANPALHAMNEMTTIHAANFFFVGKLVALAAVGIPILLTKTNWFKKTKEQFRFLEHYVAASLVLPASAGLIVVANNVLVLLLHLP